MENIPEKPNRSQFSCERYSFMLLAPFNASNKCCKYLKKDIAHLYSKKTGKKAITAQMAVESRLRAQQWLRNGCNGFDMEIPVSNPMSFWTEQDVLEYCYLNNIKLASVYGEVKIEGREEVEADGQYNFADLGIFDEGKPIYYTTGCKRTGCFACLFSKHREHTLDDCRINMIKQVSNPKFADWMLRGGHFRDSDGMWEPEGGLGMWFVMEWCNKYGDMKYVYPDRDYYVRKYSTEETEKHLHLFDNEETDDKRGSEQQTSSDNQRIDRRIASDD